MAKRRGRILLSSFSVVFFLYETEDSLECGGRILFEKEGDPFGIFFVYKNVPLHVQGSLTSCVALAKAFVSWLPLLIT